MNYYEVLVEYEALAVQNPFLYASRQDLPCSIRVQIPFRNRHIIGIVTKKLEEKPSVSYPILEIEKVLDQEPLFGKELFELAGHIRNRTISSLISVYKTMLPKAYKPSSSSARRVMEDWLQPVQDIPYDNLSQKQKEFLESINWPIKASIARKEYSSYMVSALIKKQVLTVFQRPKSAALLPDVQKQPWPKLQPQQREAIEFIMQEEARNFLLYGVTGSGKTEVFFHLAKQAIEMNKQVLLLVPEIGLTPMMISRVASRFDCEILIYHSRLSDSEMAYQYERVREMKGGIVIGTRSAVFLPFSNLGLIIMDEEHDPSYKQDKTPKYHTRDAAMFRAAWHDCKLVMASATPSLESYARAWKGVYKLVTLPERVSKNVPAIHVLDMKQQQTYDSLSITLIRAIEKTLEKGFQAVLLLNRRGYHPTMTCTSCHESLLCPDCGIPLSYHKHENAMVCHICNMHYAIPKVCPSCGSADWSNKGMGTQKLEETLEKLFPAAKIVRMDADSTRTKHGHAEVLSAFEKEGDILIGTQMVAKGLDFERVTLVGILSADGALSRADFRACESGYDMMEQAAGRCGRGKFPGQVYIQSWNPDHYALHNIVQHNYQGFFKREMGYRHLGNYPPFVYMATVILISADSMESYQQAVEARDFFEKRGIKVLGPMEISMRKKLIRNRLVLKEKNEQKLLDVLWEFSGKFRKAKFEINMNPVVLEE